MKTLVLCRHAKSDWPAGVADIDRPLKERGINNANFLGGLLGNQEFLPDLIISSPANRALSTARLVARQLGYAKEKIQIERSVYFEGSQSLLNTIKQLPNTADTVMIFGHNPTMEDTVRHILQSEAAFYMPTSAMACMESFGHRWESFGTQSAHLRWMLIPRLKRKEE